jgi:hypothetical protein
MELILHTLDTRDECSEDVTGFSASGSDTGVRVSEMWENTRQK